MSGRLKSPGTKGPVNRGKQKAPVLTSVSPVTNLAQSGGSGGVTGRLPTSNIVQFSGLSVAGVSGSGSANLAAITATVNGQVLQMSGGVLTFGTVSLSGLGNGAATSVLGVAGGSAATRADIAATADGQVLQRSSGALAFGLVSLTASVTGTLPLGNLPSNIPYSQLVNGTGLSVVGVTGNAAAANADIVAGTDGYVLRRSGTTLAFGLVSLTAGVTGQLPLANLASIGAGTVLGNNGGSSAAPSAITPSQALDIIGATQGDILYRSATGWQVLAPTAGALVSGGPSTNPSWVSVVLGNGNFQTGAGSPQGVLAAAVGTWYTDSGTGELWAKRGGASTAFGWYCLPLPASANAGSKIAAQWVPNSGGATAGTSAFLGVGDGFFGAAAGSNTLTQNSITTAAYQMVNGLLYSTATSSTTSGTTFYVDTGSTFANELKFLDTGFDTTVEFLTGSAITSVRLWFAISSVSMANQANFNTSGNVVAIRYDSATDSTWTGLTFTGGTASTTTITGSSIAASTAYGLRIRFVRSGTPTVYFSVNDGTEVSLTTNIPATGDTYALAVGAVQLSASARTWGMRKLGATWG